MLVDYTRDDSASKGPASAASFFAMFSVEMDIFSHMAIDS